MLPNPFNRNYDGHPQQHVEANGRSADVDEHLAALVARLWQLDIDTLASCQNIDGYAWLYVPRESAHHLAARWRDIVGDTVECVSGKPTSPVSFFFPSDQTGRVLQELS